MSEVNKFDVDALETQEWLQALESVVREEGVERAQFLLEHKRHGNMAKVRECNNGTTLLAQTSCGLLLVEFGDMPLLAGSVQSSRDQHRHYKQLFRRPCFAVELWGSCCVCLVGKRRICHETIVYHLSLRSHPRRGKHLSQ